MKKAVIYCRVSSEKQVREGHGLEGQEKRCQDYADHRGYTVEKVFRDYGVSGGIVERPGIQALLSYIVSKGGGFSVIVDDINRFARDVESHFILKKALIASGSELLCVNMKFEDTPDGVFFETMMAAYAQLERARNRAQVCGRMKARLELGYWPFAAPPGYRHEAAPSGGSVLNLDEPKARIVREAMEGFASGKFQTQEDVRQFLDSKRFCHSGEFKEVHPEQVKRILTRPLYAGLIHYPKWDVDIRQGKHAAIISVDTYNKIQERLGLRANKQFTRKCDNDDFPVRGFVLCSYCEKPLTASWSKGRNKRYPYYRCNSRDCHQPQKSIRKEIVEDYFAQALHSASPSHQVLELAKAITLDVYNRKIVERKEAGGVLKLKQREIEQQLAHATDKLISTSSPTVQAALEAKIENLEAEKRKLIADLKYRGEHQIDFGTALAKVMQFMANPHDAWAKGNLDQKKLVQRLVFARPVVIDPKEGVGTADLSLPFKMLKEISGGKKQLVDMPCEYWNQFNSHVGNWIGEMQAVGMY
jgi:Site-specific recombinases, DNA invertase Pin homologs